MKTLAYLISFLVGSSLSHAQDITVTVDNVTNQNGKVLFALHTAETFLNGPGIQNGESDIYSGSAVFVFEDVKPGTYAIMILHDENSNNRMDYRADGMPGESYGMSNNPMSFGPPSFIDAKFDFKEEDMFLKIRF